MIIRSSSSSMAIVIVTMIIVIIIFIIIIITVAVLLHSLFFLPGTEKKNDINTSSSHSPSKRNEKPEKRDIHTAFRFTYSQGKPDTWRQYISLKARQGSYL